ncbi:MAG: hypothetical protein JW971_01735 [Synergistales bacterium]|nr:hypothetical protein [Synergistales bacterium]
MGLNDAWEKVKTFHENFNAPVAEEPRMLSMERALARAAWMREEVDEFLEAGDIYAQADAMIDLIYFALGTMVEMGIPPEELFDAVQHANMQKLWPDGKAHFREDGKIIKPEGWEPPEKELRELIDSLCATQ